MAKKTTKAQGKRAARKTASKAKKARGTAKRTPREQAMPQEPGRFAFALTEGSNILPTTTLIPASIVPASALGSLLPTSDQSSDRVKT